MPEGELLWACEETVVCVSVSWLLQGRSQLDRLRDWRPRPRSETSGRPLDVEDMSWERAMPLPPPQLGNSILLPTAASSLSFPSEVQFRDKHSEKQVLRHGELYAVLFYIQISRGLRQTSVRLCSAPVQNDFLLRLVKSSPSRVVKPTFRLCAWRD